MTDFLPTTFRSGIGQRWLRNQFVGEDAQRTQTSSQGPAAGSVGESLGPHQQSDNVQSYATAHGRRGARASLRGRVSIFARFRDSDKNNTTSTELTVMNISNPASLCDSRVFCE